MSSKEIQAGTADNQDFAAIRAVVADSETLQSDVVGFTQLLTEDATIVNYGGRRVRGRSEIYQAMEQALQTPLAGVLTKIELEDIRLLRSAVALASGIKRIHDQRGPSATADSQPLQERARVTFVLVKEAGRWLIASVQTTPIKG